MHEIERNRSQKLGCQANGGGARAGRAPPRSANVFDTVLKIDSEKFKNADANIPIYFMKTIEIMQTFQLCLFLE